MDGMHLRCDWLQELCSVDFGTRWQENGVGGIQALQGYGARLGNKDGKATYIGREQ